jgi:putative DNA primase/helicase
MTCLETALTLAERGMFVFPLQPNAKTPLTKNGYKDATTDLDKITNWFNKWPNANIGIAAGQSHLVIIDIDVKNGVDGEASLTKLLNGHNTLPQTLQVRTPTGGRHIYFSAPENLEVKNSAGTIGLGIDVRGVGGYVVAPSSIIDGRTYDYIGADTNIAPLPDWLVMEAANPRREAKKSSNITRTANNSELITEGNRNDAIFRIASKMRADGIPLIEARRLVLDKAKACVPPLGEDEALRCLESAWRYDENLHLTDIGNGKRLVIRHGENIRFLHTRRKWLFWGGTRWIFDETGKIIEMAKDTALRINIEVAEQKDDIKRVATRKWATASESISRLTAMIELAKSEADIAVLPNELDRDQMLFGVGNGTVNLRTGMLREPRREDMITKSSGVIYDQSATCPAWIEFLDGIMGGDTEMTAFLRRAVGYSLTGNTSEQCLFLLYGTGSNGKSTFLNILDEVLGDYSASTPADALMVQQSGGVRNDLARLQGVRFVTANETEDGHKMAESLVKSLTGGDIIATRFLYAEFFEFQPQFKLFLAANHKPIIKGDDHAIWRRVRLIPFEMTFPVNRDLPNKLKSELSGILNWAIDGCLEWQQIGLKPPEKVLAATSDYRREMDFMQQFIDERCHVSPSAFVGSTELYDAYKEWAEVNTGWFLSQTKFGRKLGDRGFVKEKTPRIRYRGIGLLEEF